MRQRLSSVMPSTAVVIAFAALVAACSGLAVAASSSSPLIRACANKKTGALRLASKCRRRERALSWNREGVRGARGATGAVGAKGETGPKGETGTVNTASFYTKTESDSRYVAQSNERPFAWGQVREDASLRPHSETLIAVSHPSTGFYCLLLSRRPEQSELEGTVVTLAGTTPQAVFPRVTNGQGSDCASEPAPAVAVRFYNTSNQPEDARFSFVVP